MNSTPTGLRPRSIECRLSPRRCDAWHEGEIAKAAGAYQFRRTATEKTEVITACRSTRCGERDHALLRTSHFQDNEASPSCRWRFLCRFSRRRSNDDLASRCRQGANQLIERNVRSGPFDLGDTGLTRSQFFTKLLLRHMDSLALQANRPREFDACIEQLPLFRGHFQKIRGITDFPASHFNRLTFCGIHKLGFRSRLSMFCGLDCRIVLLQSLLTPCDDFIWNLSCLFRIDLQDQDRVGVNAIHDPPVMQGISNSKRSAPWPHIGQWFRLRHTQTLTFLKHLKKHSRFLSSLGREWRCLDLSAQPNQGFPRWFVTLVLFRFGHTPHLHCFLSQVYIGYGIQSSDKNWGLGEVCRFGSTTG